MAHTIDDVYNFLTGGLSENLVDTFLSLIKSFFSTIANFFYDLIFVDFREGAFNFGSKIFSFFSSFFFAQPFSLQALIYAVGFILIIFFIKLVVQLIRG